MKEEKPLIENEISEEINEKEVLDDDSDWIKKFVINI